VGSRPLIAKGSPPWRPGRGFGQLTSSRVVGSGKLSGVSADDPLDPAEGGIVASTAAVLALRDLLVAKGIITSDEFVEALDRHSAFIVEQLRQRREAEAEGEAEGDDEGGRSWSRWRR
jgi:hypothetical protein